GAGANRMSAEAVVADLGDVLLRHHDPGRRRGGAVEGHEVGPWLLQVEAHRQRIDGLDLSDTRLELRRARALVALEPELHVLGRDGVAVVELEPSAQLELIALGVGTLLPRLRQARTHLVSRIR